MSYFTSPNSSEIHTRYRYHQSLYPKRTCKDFQPQELRCQSYYPQISLLDRMDFWLGRLLSSNLRSSCCFAYLVTRSSSPFQEVTHQHHEALRLHMRRRDHRTHGHSTPSSSFRPFLGCCGILDQKWNVVERVADNVSSSFYVQGSSNLHKIRVELSLLH